LALFTVVGQIAWMVPRLVPGAGRKP